MNKTSKKWASLLLALLLLLACTLPALAAEGLTVSAGSASGKAGETVKLDISVNHNPGISGMSLKLDYDRDALTLTGVENLAGGSISLNLEKGIISWLLGHNTRTEGSYFTLTFAISAKAAAGTYPVTLSLTDGKEKNLVNEDAAPVPAAFAAGSVKVTASASGDACHPFTDVEKSAWYHEAVDYVWQHGLMNGMGNDLFEPGTTMSRAMVVTVLYRMEGSPAPGAANAFEDVEPGKWYTEAVTWANENGIVLGYGNGCFGPSDDVTREQIAAILQRYAGFKGMDVSRRAELSAFEDAASVSAWAREPMEWAVAVGLIVGRTETSLVPGGNATRAEVATLLMRFATGIVKA